jgi:hypothetical protein
MLSQPRLDKSKSKRRGNPQAQKNESSQIRRDGREIAELSLLACRGSEMLSAKAPLAELRRVWHC